MKEPWSTWATVGSCAQMGKTSIYGGVGIWCAKSQLQAAPAIIEDNAFIGSRCIVVEGSWSEKQSLGANVVPLATKSSILLRKPQRK